MYPPNQPPQPGDSGPGWQPTPPPPPPPSDGSWQDWQAPPPPRGPGRIQRFINWYSALSGPMKIVVGIIILACTIFVCSAAVSGVVQGSQAQVTPTAAVAANQPTATSAPTQAPTQAPTPTRTPTVKQNIIQIVNANTTSADKIDFTQNDGSTVIVQITLSEMLDQGDARNTIQLNCYNIEKALWTNHIKSLKDVNLAFRGPSMDKFGNKSTSPYGLCDLTKATAAKFNWDNLTDASAWNAYDQAEFFTIIAG